MGYAIRMNHEQSNIIFVLVDETVQSLYLCCCLSHGNLVDGILGDG